MMLTVLIRLIMFSKYLRYIFVWISSFRTHKKVKRIVSDGLLYTNPIIATGNCLSV